MAQITLQNNPINTCGELPKLGEKAPDFRLVAGDLSNKSLSDFAGKTIVLNIFPSLDTPTCATSVREFNSRAAALPGVQVLCISHDLPFAQGRFCTSEGIENLLCLSSFRAPEFGSTYGQTIEGGVLDALLARAIVVIDASGKVIYTEQVHEIADEPNYEKALAAISAA